MQVFGNGQDSAETFKFNKSTLQMSSKKPSTRYASVGKQLIFEEDKTACFNAPDSYREYHSKFDTSNY